MEHDELAQYLESIEREKCYRVDDVLKESVHEITQRVFFVGENGSERGPFIRKFIQQKSGLGSAYQRVFEAQQSGCRFKYIPDILECYTRDGQLVVVMEYVHGSTLQEAIYQHDPSLSFAQRVFPLICDAVCELHTEFDSPIIHRDLKPSNIILTGHGLALIDFGISREYREQAECDTMHFGTREFAPPEQFGFGQTGVYSDVYSLGMVLYYCLTERVPSSQVRKDSFADPSIPECVRAVIEHACSLDPAMRYASASDLKDAFLDAVSLYHADGRSDATQAKEAELSQNSPKRRIALAVAAVACALVIVIGIGAYALFVQGEKEQSQIGNVQTPSSVQPQASSADTSRAAANEAADSSITYYVIDDAGISAQERESIYNTSNVFSKTVCGVEFEIPAYFKTSGVEIRRDTRGAFPETGPNFAMIIIEERGIDEGWENADHDYARIKDEFVAGVKAWNETLCTETLVAPADYKLNGYPARNLLFKGTVNGSPVHTMLLLIVNPELKKVGAVYCCESIDDRYMYSVDFNKVLTSAMK